MTATKLEKLEVELLCQKYNIDSYKDALELYENIKKGKCPEK